MIAEVNGEREEKDRVLLIVDGVHGLGVENPNITALGCDAFSAGTHKWIFGPRGTGFVWAKPSVWASMRPLIPSDHSLQPFEAWAEEREPTPPARAAWFSPGGFQAFEHFWALPAAFDFHQNIGPARITKRTRELNRYLKEDLARMPHVQLHTPLDDNLSAGMVCFEVRGLQPQQVVQRLLRKKIIASTTPYHVSYARIGASIINTPEEVDKTLHEISHMG
jgi:selenocysteine lyase/cysteine desulfurase